MQAATDHCREAWLHCEQLLLVIAKSEAGYASRVRKVLKECADICLGTLEALRRESQASNHFALLCAGICIECAECCSRYPLPCFHGCADACMACAEAMSLIAGI